VQVISETTPGNAAGYRQKCVNSGSTFYEWSNTEGFDWGAALPRWSGSVKATVNANCGGALLVGGALTEELRGVPLRDIVKLSYRARREAPVGGDKGNLNLQFDFDTDRATQQVGGYGPPPAGPYASLDTADQGRAYFRSTGDNAWAEIVAIAGGASASDTWVTSKAPGCTSGSCSLATLKSTYPNAAFASSYNLLAQAPVSPKIALKWGTQDSGQYVFYIDSVTIHWNDAGGALKKRTWAFKVGRMAGSGGEQTRAANWGAARRLAARLTAPVPCVHTVACSDPPPPAPLPAGGGDAHARARRAGGRR
jgi:hypothetical protein